MDQQITNQQLIQNFLHDCKVQGMTKRTIESYHSSLRCFQKFLNKKDTKIEKVKKHLLQEYLLYLRETKKLKYKTIGNRFSALSSLYQYLVWEEIIQSNIVLEVRKRYLKTYKKNPGEKETRKAISIEDMSLLANSIIDRRDKAILVLLAKTGIRRQELIAIDLEDINWEDNSIQLKTFAKRTNRTVYFDGECAMVLRRWIQIRKEYNTQITNALFINTTGHRLKRSGVYNTIRKWSEQLGLYDNNSKKLADHFTPHSCRHWFTTHLRRNGMPREYIQELRGDVRREAIDIYDHIDQEELRISYLSTIPQLNIY